MHKGFYLYNDVWAEGSINQEAIDQIALRVLAKNSELKNFVLTFSFVLMLAGAYAAPLWGPAAVGFLQIAGVSAVIAAKKMLSPFLMNPTLLLYNPSESI